METLSSLSRDLDPGLLVEQQLRFPSVAWRTHLQWCCDSFLCQMLHSGGALSDDGAESASTLRNPLLFPLGFTLED